MSEIWKKTGERRRISRVCRRFSRIFLRIKKETETVATRKFTSETTISVSRIRQNSGGHYTRTKIPCKPLAREHIIEI